MLDVKLLREDLARVKERLATRGAEIEWDEFVSLDRERRDALANLERLKEKKNRLSGEIGKMKKAGGNAALLMQEVEKVSEAIQAGEGQLTDLGENGEDHTVRRQRFVTVWRKVNGEWKVAHDIAVDTTR